MSGLSEYLSRPAAIADGAEARLVGRDEPVPQASGTDRMLMAFEPQQGMAWFWFERPKPPTYFYNGRTAKGRARRT